MNEEIRQIPLGESSFEKIRERNLYYVDKTEYIERLELNEPFAILNRPRRFGKSLFLSTLEKYYDRNTTDEEFERLFKGLYIYDHRTKFVQKYVIIHFDFSQVRPGKTYEETEDSFGKYLMKRIKEIAETYSDSLGQKSVDEITSCDDWDSMTNALMMELNAKKILAYLVIDEYDNFTNTIMAENPDQYLRITHSIGFLRSFFKKCKNPMIDRILLVGIAPVTHDDLTSGLGYCYPIGMEKMFNYILGFSESEVRTMVDYYQQYYDLGMTTDEIIADIKPWYDNYCFSPDCVKDERIYLTDAVLMYIKFLVRYGKAPLEMIDPATAIDWKKIEMMAVKDKSNMIGRLFEDGYYETTIISRFDFNRMGDPDIFPSLLYYFGLATIKSDYRNTQTMVIPNNNVRYQFFEKFRQKYIDMEVLNSDYLNKLKKSVSQASLTGEWKPLFTHILGKWKEVSSIRQTIQGERAMQSFVMALFSLSNDYLLRPEMELSKGYADIVLFPNFARYDDIEHSFIIELKVAKRDADEDTVKKLRDEAVQQANEYASDPVIPSLVRNSMLHKCVIVMKGWDVECMEEV